MQEKIIDIINRGETITTEFKEAHDALPKELFETVCAFLNTIGGYIILGVNDSKKIIGIDKDKISKIKKSFSDRCNNLEQIDPLIMYELKEVEINGKILLYTYIKESPTLHRHKKKVFVRSHEGDYDISGNFALITNLYNQKNKIYDEDRIFPNVSIEDDLRIDLIDEAKRMAQGNVNKEHPWQKMSYLEMLKSANLYRVDEETGKEGVTLAGIMIFGKDTTIKQHAHYARIDAIYRKNDLDRYDDREMFHTNLIEMYYKLVEFIGKHTLDRFALTNDAKRRYSPRNVMAREMVLNIIMHRAILDGHTSRIIIYEDKIISENPNNFSSMKEINVHNYMPFSKNPTICDFFREIGLADELGSGVRRITESSLSYSGKLPIFEDKEIFRLTIPLERDEDIPETGILISDVKIPYGLKDNERKVLKKIKEDPYITSNELANMMNLSERTIQNIQKTLKENGIISKVGNTSNSYWNINLK